MNTNSIPTAAVGATALRTIGATCSIQANALGVSSLVVVAKSVSRAVLLASSISAICAVPIRIANAGVALQRAVATANECSRAVDASVAHVTNAVAAVATVSVLAAVVSTILAASLRILIRVSNINWKRRQRVVIKLVVFWRRLEGAHCLGVDCSHGGHGGQHAHNEYQEE